MTGYQDEEGRHYVLCGSRYLRCGRTTGTCAALAAKAAALEFLCGRREKKVSLVAPKGWLIEAEPQYLSADGVCSAGVEKDAGDDDDATDGCLVVANLRFYKEESGPLEIEIDGGRGVGRVTRAGLEQPVGAAAINSVPRAMIREAVCSVCEEAGFCGRVSVLIEVPEGGLIAARTFNPRLGIEGGISILGTSGIVEPQSEAALCDSIGLELRQISLQQEGRKFRPVILTPGNYGLEFIRENARFAEFRDFPVAVCSNFIGRALDLCSALKFTRVLLVGHAGKLVKLAGGIMDTRSRTADCRTEIIAAHAALCGASRELAARIMDCLTVDACLSAIRDFDAQNSAQIFGHTVDSIMQKIGLHLEQRAAGAFETGAVLFTREHGLLGWV